MDKHLSSMVLLLMCLLMQIKTYSLLFSTHNIIMVKLKKKVSFKGHAFFEPVRREKIFEALIYLKK